MSKYPNSYSSIPTRYATPKTRQTLSVKEGDLLWNGLLPQPKINLEFKVNKWWGKDGPGRI